MSDIADLFATDPLKLTLEDRSAIIAYYRENREKFLTSGKGTKSPKPDRPTTKFSLDDLEL